MAWAPDYITVDELKAYVRIPADDEVDDAELAEHVTAASRCVDGTCGRQFGQVATVQLRRYPSLYQTDERTYVAQIDDLADVTGLVVTSPAGSAVAAANYTLLPRNAVAKNRVYEAILLPGCGDYEITALWGWSAVPAAVKLATKLQASRFLARRDSPFGVAGSPQDGSEIRLLARVDPDVEVILRRGRLARNWWAA